MAGTTVATTVEATTAATSAAAKTTGWATQSVGEKVFSVAIFGLSTAATLALAYYLFAEPTRLSELWAWARSLPVLLQLALWLLCLPWMVALWIWSLPWAFAIRFALVLGVLIFTEYLVYPIK